MTFERRILTNYDASTAGFDRGTRRVEQALARLQRTTDNRLSQIDRRFERAGRAALRMGTALGAVLGVAGAGAAIRGAQQYAEAWRQVERDLTAAGFAADGNQEKLAQLAIRIRGDFEATSSAVSRFARTTGTDLETAIRRVETLRKILAVGGATSAEQSSVSLQLTQALQSGTLQGDELRSIREAAPVEFLDALAKRAGGARAELKKLGEDGKLSTAVIIGALDDLATTADAKFGALAISGSEAVEVLQTGFATFFGRLDQELGATAGVNEFLVNLGTFLADDAEAAATFAKSLEVAAVAAASLAGGKALGAVTASLQAGSAARKVAVTQAEALVAATTKEAQARRLSLATLQRETAQRAVSEGGIRNLEAANKRLATARVALTGAETRAVAATNALAVAQGNLSAATRLTAGAMATLRGALAFFGGVPGLIFTAVAAVVLFSDTLFGARDAAGEAESALDGFDATANKLRSTQQALEGDTEALTAANERLQGAIEAQQGAAIDTARIEIDAINRRIAKNQELKATYDIILRAQLATAEGELAATRSSLQRRFGGSGITRAELLDETAPALNDQRLQTERREQALRDRRARISAAQDAGQVLTASDREFLDTAALVAELEDRARSAREALEKLGEPIEVAAPAPLPLPEPVSRGGGRGGGGRAAQTREERDAYRELIETAAERQRQLLDEIALEQQRGGAIELTRAQAVELAALEEKQRLLTEARRADIALTPEQTALIDEQARAYGELAVEVDDLRAARDLIRDATEAGLTVEQRVIAMKERLIELLPQVIQLTGDEARARELLAAASERYEDEIRDTSDATDEWASKLGSAISQANSLDDALQNLLKTFIELAATEFFNALLGSGPQGGTSSKSSIFGQIGLAIAGAFAGSAGGSVLGVSGASTNAAGYLQLKFAAGGYTGGHRNDIRGVVHGEEYVVRAGPAKKHLPLLEAINKGAVPGFSRGGEVSKTIMPLGLESDRPIPGFASGGFVSASLPRIPITPTVPRLAGARTTTEMIDARMTINIDEPGASAEEIMRKIEPRLARHQAETIVKIRRENRLNPEFLER